MTTNISQIVSEIEYDDNWQDVLSKKWDDQYEWLIDVGSSLSKWGEIANISTMMEAEILYIVSNVWERIQPEARSQWGYRFMDWAIQFTKKTSSDPAENTILNKITVYRDWIADSKIKYPKHITVIENNETLEIEFDPKNVDYGKLLVSRGQARKGNFTQQDWNLLGDPNSTVRELGERIKLMRNGHNKKKEHTTYHAESGLIYARKGDRTAVLFTMEQDQENDPELFVEGVRHILLTAGLDPVSIFNETL